MPVNSAQRARAVGSVLGMATGDALGAGYEFEPPLPASIPVEMKGGGAFGWAPGEWTDDTSMAIPILDALARGADLLDPATQDEVATRWKRWSGEATDVGTHTRSVLRRVSAPVAAEDLTAIAAGIFAAGHNSAGNGTLMRTTPIVLGYLHDPAGLTAAATAYSLITHGDPQAAQACVLWNHAQRHAILTGELDIRVGLAELPPRDAQVWLDRIEAAERSSPAELGSNGWVVRALQAAWSAISRTPQDGPEHFAQALEAAVRAGDDTDTVAAIAGGLLGAAWGVAAIPARWRRLLHGWPGITGQELLRRTAGALAGGGAPGQWPQVDRMAYGGRPVVVQHPDDEGVWIGNYAGLAELPDEVDAVVSLCRMGTAELPSRIRAEHHVEVWILDEADPAQNPHLGFVIDDTVALLEAWRAAGRNVYLHCVHAHSRTPLLAVAYGSRVSGRSGPEVLSSVAELLPNMRLNHRFAEILANWPPSTSV
jgi:ADP-ribosylglycohydrolase